MRWGWIVAVALLLAGCAAPPAPQPPDEAAIREELERQELAHWQFIAPDEPPPHVEELRVVDDYTEQWSLVLECMSGLELDGVDIHVEAGGWSASEDPEIVNAAERAQWMCAAQYPVDPASPDLEYLMTEEQARYLWGFYTTRLMPCFEAHGFPLSQVPSRAEYLSQRWWSPYYALSRSPMSRADLAWLDAACPPPPIPVQRPF